MRALVVYESMYGNTHRIAEAIGEGLAEGFQVDVVPVEHAGAGLVEAADLLVVGGPTHAHSLSRAGTRASAAAEARKPGSTLILDPAAEGPGLREWLDAPLVTQARAAAFDTRMDAPAVLTGRAAKGIARRLRQRGLELVGEPESFLVTKQNHLEPQEVGRAREWGRQLVGSLTPRG
ncbi:flavodoxin domain-containing protein [Phytohabitans sp. ZYX-F-186]|uniref:Flavodoxin domain-containing protein n=1 Tax=Phytohabitans maris TaxID=3071409 RepID=A0ABU0ZMK9_9ACTN|nr:flavodoxin domain-containing protein [Phytohabitans sp. ZYX-F-186]MDQ7908269.1 flavodoxin domain-containing protein [Phytohabitans sp. ZYX-F-186]